MEVDFFMNFERISTLFTLDDKEYYIVRYLENRNFKKFNKRKRLIVKTLDMCSYRWAKKHKESLRIADEISDILYKNHEVS